MAPPKKVQTQVKLQIVAGKATPAPPVGPALGQAQVNIMEFCKQFNARTQSKDMEGLVYGLTKIRHEDGVAWYQKPATLAVLVLILVIILNFWFA